MDNNFDFTIGKISWFGACFYYLFACECFLAQAQFFIVYELICMQVT